MTNIRSTTREMIERLIGFDTTSAKSNLALIDFAQEPSVTLPFPRYSTYPAALSCSIIR